MSLIYKALQRSRRQNPLLPGTETGPVVRKNVITWRNFLLSPRAVLAAGASLFLLGALSAHFVNLAAARTPTLTPHAQAAVSATHRVSPAEEPPADLAGREPVPVPAAAGAAVKGRQPDPVKSPFRFYPAESSSARPMPLEQPAGEADAKTTDRAAALFLPASGEHVGGMPAGDNSPANPAPTASALPGAGSITEGSDRSRDTGGSSPKPMPQISPGESFNRGGDDPVHQRQAEQAQQHLKVARLAGQMVSAAQDGDVARSADLLGQLTEIKGSKNLFVQKLAAYSQIQQGNLEKARELLTAILAIQPDDMEAGLNMAVVDIRQGRKDRARHRLERLLDLYPEEGRINYFLGQLRH